MNYLYRGVSIQMHEDHKGQLVPKNLTPFMYTFHYGEKGLKYGLGATYGSSETNAVIRHQLNQESFPTSGVSTTPFFDRAKYYATGGGKHKGYVYIIDRSLLGVYCIREFTVSDFTVSPSIPEDREIILVASGYGVLPEQIVVEVKPV